MENSSYIMRHRQDTIATQLPQNTYRIRTVVNHSWRDQDRTLFKNLFVEDVSMTSFVCVMGTYNTHDTHIAHDQTSSGIVTENVYLGVHAGDVLTVDRAAAPKIGNLVLTVHDGIPAISRLTEHEGVRYLVFGTKRKDRRELRDNEGDFVWGVVSALSRRL